MIDQSNQKIAYSIVSSATIVLMIASMISTGYVGIGYAQIAGLDPQGVPHYFGPYPNYATSQLPFTDWINGTVTGGIRKFIDSLPGLGPTGANNLGQYIPIAVPDTTTYPGCEYYEIALVQYTEKMHSDLTPTTLRGYVQLSTSIVPGSQVPLTYLNGSAIIVNGVQAEAVDNPHYLGPFIIAQRDLPVRITFRNLLPTQGDGDLFLPVDTSVMGAGDGPRQIGVDSMGMPIYEQYTENRATVHLHGGNTPWISDGTAHQWTTPAGENTSYPKGVSVAYVPDMWFVNGSVVANTVGQTTAPQAGATNNPGEGALTFYYTNQQSARLLFYHDHAYGITRLNVYAGEAAGYLITDSIEQELIANGGVLTGLGYGIPLVVQDKTFVPDYSTPITNIWGSFASQLAFQDPTWDVAKWGGTNGSLWYPHVYVPMQNPSDPSGMNLIGRWQYSPWFWPPFQPMFGPVDNPYAGDTTYSSMGVLEGTKIPGTPNPSMPGEAFMDTPLVNGAAYPYLEVDPTTYRFRILNAADDRMWNLQWYVADPAVITADGRTNTEVKMVDAVFNATYPAYWPADGRVGGVPDPNTRGPAWIQIGSEGGFLPEPVLMLNQPLGFNLDKGTFDFANVNQHTLLLGTAERADVLVDFSQYAGQTLILYNDAVAPIPAPDPRLDYYTGNPDQSDAGGAPSTIAGYGPNTRTIMQVRVKGTAGTPPVDGYNSTTLATLQAAFASTATTQGVFARDQNTIIVPQAAYCSAYNTTFADVWSNIFDSSLTFTPVGSNTTVTIPMQAKSMHDEMGGTFDTMYGRMMTSLGVEIPKSTPATATTILYGYADPPTEIIKTSVSGTQIGTLGDGTQIWKITHNGVDTHTLHWHMYDVQLINRVAWDNNVRWPDANELGWKDTIRINPLTDTIIALRPIMPNLPFDLPNNVRPLDPTKPLGITLKDAGAGVMDPTGVPITIVNHMVNYGYEFTWHCHILAHEEMDMMRAVAVAVAPREPSYLVAFKAGTKATLIWADNSLSETGFTIQRANDANFTTGLVTFTVGANVKTYTDTTIKNNQNYYYRVQANNVVGDTYVYAAPAVGFPSIQVDSAWSNTALVGTGTPPAAPSNLITTTVTRSSVSLAWNDNSNNEAGFLIQRATNSGFSQGVTDFMVGPGATTFTDTTVAPNTRYYYRVLAFSATGNSAWSNSINIRTLA